MIGLPKQVAPLIRLRNRRIFDCLLGGNRNQENRPTIRFKNAIQFAHRLPVVLNMFKHMAAINNIKCFVQILNIGNIAFLNELERGMGFFVGDNLHAPVFFNSNRNAISICTIARGLRKSAVMY
jgi:hypothetical protein